MMTSLSINCNMPPLDWSSIQEGRGGIQAVTERSEKKKKKNIKRKIKIKLKLKQNKYKKKKK